MYNGLNIEPVKVFVHGLMRDRDGTIMYVLCTQSTRITRVNDNIIVYYARDT